jgi:hypothetical protein
MVGLASRSSLPFKATRNLLVAVLSHCVGMMEDAGWLHGTTGATLNIRITRAATARLRRASFYFFQRLSSGGDEITADALVPWATVTSAAKNGLPRRTCSLKISMPLESAASQASLSSPFS